MEKKYKVADTIFYDPRTGEFIRKEKKEKSPAQTKKRKSILGFKKKKKPEAEEEDFDNEPEIVFLKSDKEKLTDKTPATISWEVDNASDVRINDNPVSSSGTMPFHVKEPGSLTLTARKKGKRPVSKSIPIDIDNTPPAINSFTSNKEFVLKNKAVSLSWNITGAERVSIDNGVGDVSNRQSITVIPYESSIYHLTAENYFGAKSYAELSVTVFPTPLIKNLFLPRPEFNIQLISETQPHFNLTADIHAPIQTSLPVFTGLDPFTKLGKEATKILLNKETIDSVLFSNNIFHILIQKQKEISHIIKSSWKKKIPQLLKEVLK